MIKKSRSLRNQKGATLVEYVLLVGLIIVVAVGAMSTFGDTIENFFTQVEGKVPSV